MPKKYPLGIQTFSEIATGNYYYADKTDAVYRLAHYAKFHFLSRPRRFGKSLLVSTLQAYFEGKKELFDGLAIERLEQEWTVYPVLHFDISQSKYFDDSSVKATLDALLKHYEAQYGLQPSAGLTCSNRLAAVIEAAARQTGKQVVVLVDEYDALVPGKAEYSRMWGHDVPVVFDVGEEKRSVQTAISYSFRKEIIRVSSSMFSFLIWI